MVVVSSSFFVCIQLFMFKVSSSVLPHLLLKGYCPPRLLHFGDANYAAHLIFALTLGTASSLFLLVFGEIINLFSKGTRWHYWQLNLSLLLLLVIVIIPWYQIYAFLHQVRRWKQRWSIYAATLLWSIYIFYFSKAATLNYLPSIENENSDYTWIELGIFRVSVIGITVTSILSGFGVINAPFSVYTAYSQHVTESEFNMAQQAYENTLVTIHEKQVTLEHLYQSDIQNGRSASHQKPYAFFGRILSSVIPNQNQEESKLLQVEIEQLENLAVNMKSDLDELCKSRQRSELSKTWKGKCRHIIDLVFAVYCVYKLFTTTVNVLLRRTGTGDPITNTLSLLISHFGKDKFVNTVFWSQQLSFWFAGIIVFGSVRSALNLVTKIIRNFSRKFILSTSNILLFMSHMLGMYFLSSVLMMQVSLPANYRYLISSTLEHIEFTFFQRWSDIILVVSSLITSVILYVISQTSNAKSLATDYADMQLLSVENGSVNTRPILSGNQRLD